MLHPSARPGAAAIVPAGATVADGKLPFFCLDSAVIWQCLLITRWTSVGATTTECLAVVCIAVLVVNQLVTRAASGVEISFAISTHPVVLICYQVATIGWHDFAFAYGAHFVFTAMVAGVYVCESFIALLAVFCVICDALAAIIVSFAGFCREVGVDIA